MSEEEQGGVHVVGSVRKVPEFDGVDEVSHVGNVLLDEFIGVVMW